MNQTQRPMICSPQNNPDLFQYLCQRATQINVQKFSNSVIKGFKIEPLFTEDVEDANEIKHTTTP
jgi:hypothetical protein